MLNLSLHVYSTPAAADRVATTLLAYDERSAPILDYAVVSWPLARSRPNTYPAMAGASGTLDLGSLWGALFGLSFYIPLRATPARATQIDLSHSLDTIGLDADIILAIQHWVRPGTSALFIVSPEPITGRTSACAQPSPVFMLERTLPADLEQRLTALFMV